MKSKINLLCEIASCVLLSLINVLEVNALLIVCY